MDCSKMNPYEVRRLIRNEEIIEPTAGMCAGYAQANLVILPKELAYDFLLFTQRNSKSCPILEVGDVGDKIMKFLGEDIDITTDIPKYRVYEDGIMTGEYTNIKDFWRDDFVSFLIGCSFSFESDLLEENITIRHIEEKCNVPMYITNIDCVPAGIFNGKMVVSMRPLPYSEIVKSVLISGSMPKVHGAPVHIGDPNIIGIKDINKPHFGDRVTIKEGEVPVFWPCGVTPQSVIMNVKPKIVITHAPGHMLITDIKNSSLKY
ncbi:MULTISPECIES: putative hydro-lyase [Clostridium]|uniref:putative hydro-lyase n=1 Tax=Clostridium TaxID=1485 RepID=UPI00129A30E3|nr:MULTISPECIES: putative hydro-lyase [Clostridium]MDU1069234.1 putative hydro-lyase [Clostridium sp.]MDU2677956.1 putative hydro-lyase [Clostridium sp.]MDU3581763.1 putative hydro-lyase [Clostridium butyricum]MDU3595239.1 putative hydro-lyase [Clostridium butyricum]MDU4212389.1 putative hydro-lyase [Clostridium sp.]